jgi:hypothetical protein
MSLGFVSQDMDDKWDIYLDGDTFYFHRSWTGLCIFRMRLQRKDGDYEILEASVARYPTPSSWWKLWQRLRPPSPRDAPLDREARVLSFLIDVDLLGKPGAPYRGWPDVPPPGEVGMTQGA